MLATQFVSLVLENLESGEWDGKNDMFPTHVISLPPTESGATDFMRDILTAHFHKVLERDVNCSHAGLLLPLGFARLVRLRRRRQRVPDPALEARPRLACSTSGYARTALRRAYAQDHACSPTH